MFEKVGISRISIGLIFLAALVAYSSAQQNETASSERKICHENLDKCLAVCTTETNRTICENECPTCPILSSTSGGKFGLGYDQNGPCCIIVNATEDCHSRELSPASRCHRKRHRDCGEFCTAGMMYAERVTKCSEPTENEMPACHETISYVKPTHSWDRRRLLNPNPQPISMTAGFENDIVIAVTGPNNNVHNSGFGNNVTVSGSGNIIVVPGHDNYVHVSGTGNNLQVGGSDNGIKVSSFDSHVVVIGSGNDINVSGSDHNVVVHGSGKHVVVDGIGKHVEVN